MHGRRPPRNAPRPNRRWTWPPLRQRPAVRRIEDPALVTGQGRFTDDVAPARPAAPGLRALARTRTPHRGIDTDAARAMPGVVAVYTGADLVAAGVKPMAGAHRLQAARRQPMPAPPRALAHEVVRFVGEAGGRGGGRHAATPRRPPPTRSSSTTRSCPPWSDPRRALAPARRCVGGRRPTTSAPRCATATPPRPRPPSPRRARGALDLVNQRLAPSPMEPRSVLAWVMDGPARRPPGGAPVQPDAHRRARRPGRRAARPDADNVRVLVGDVGGGFGMKTGIYPEDIAVAWAALQLAAR
jgi:aerobic carbon-monoxide dehydrogenase large subunit